MRLPKVAWILIIVTTLSGLFVYVQQTGWSPLGSVDVFSQVADERLFVPETLGGPSQEEARKIYADSLRALKEGDYAAANEGFVKLQKPYPGLDELLSLHIAEARAEQSNELGAQTVLKNTLKRRPNSLLAPALQYQLALSHFRASEWDKARAAFEKLARKYPDSDYKTASLYYLGLIELKQPTPDQSRVVNYWRQYLQDCPDCTFSADIAERLEPMINIPSAADHKLLGQGYASGDRNNDKALEHLKQAPLPEVWKELAKTQLQAGHRTDATETVMKGLRFAKTRDEAQAAIDDVLMKACTSCSATLKELDAMNLPKAGDYVLWKLAALNPADAQKYYRQIVSRFPSGDYAPESSWNLLWPLLKAGETSEFLAKAQTHLTKYGYSRSAPKTLFWIGKVLEKSDRTEAQNTYERVLKDYPYDYYAYRAWGRLEYLRTGDDPGWGKQPHDSFPPSFDWRSLAIVPKQTEFLKQHATEGRRMYNAAQELQQIGAAADLRIVSKEVFGETPPVIESWALHQEGDKMRAIRTVRDDLAKRNMPQSEAERADNATPALPSVDELRLMYPLYYADIIAVEAPKKGVDPYIAQSLMREESYYNEVAVSSSNALGLMQLLPSTAQEVANWEGMSGFHQTMLFDPAVNIRLGTRYLAYLLKTFNGTAHPEMLMVGSYNGGPNAMKRWVSATPQFTSDPDMFVELIPYEQTRDYIKKVYGSYWNYHRLYAPGEGNKGLR